jgi:hypothetical protein
MGINDSDAIGVLTVLTGIATFIFGLGFVVGALIF